MSTSPAQRGLRLTRARGRDRGRGHGVLGATNRPVDAQAGRYHPGSARPDAPLPRRGVDRGGRAERPPGDVIFMQDRPNPVDARIQDDTDKAVVARLGQSHAAHTGADPRYDLPLRPDFGTQGRAISLRANYFPVDVQPESRIFLYGAEIALAGRAGKLSGRIKQRVFRLAAESAHWAQAGMLGRVAHDNAGKLVASFELPQPLTIRGAYRGEEEEGPSPEDATEYALTLTYVEEVDQAILKECLAGVPVDSQALAKVLSALNLVLTMHPSQTGINIGRGDETKKHPDQRLFFDTPKPRDIGGGLTAREGFYVSVRPAHQQLMVNVNKCHAAFYKPQNFVDAMREYREFTGRDAGAGAFGSQVRVKTKPKGHVVMIQGMSRQNAHQRKFKHGKFGWISIAEYYEREHKMKLDHPELPLLEGPNGNYYPQEVCSILSDQGYKGELTDKKHAKEMLDVASKPPKENADGIINTGLNKLGFQDSNPVLESFGVHVGTEMAVVPGRVLDKPGLSYSAHKQADIDAERASWNLRGVKFAVGAQLDRWAVLVVKDGQPRGFRDGNDRVWWNIAEEFRVMCNRSGMKVRRLEEAAYAEVQLPPRQGKHDFRDEAINAIKSAMEALKGRATPELVLVFLSNDDKAIYCGLKRLCDVELDIATVCMQSAKVDKEKGRQQYFANVALKVNTKMGGINHTLDSNSGAWLKNASTMIMGMDVTHPTKGVSIGGTPSIVAVVASIDEHFAQYPMALSIRKSKVEIDRGRGNNDDRALTDMFISRFELYKANNRGKLPERVILYRDGVSESQFVQVRQYELRAIKEAMAHFNSTRTRYEPKLTIVVCNKRHHTRFYPTQKEDAAADGNPLPGTVVDRGVTPAYEFDFFLQAHGALKGNARPTHYFVIHDENGFTADELQRVTNDLSYMFARATKAVSLVSPAYWADVACERGRCYLHKLLMGAKEGASESKDKGKGKEKGGERKRKERAEGAVFEQAEEMWGRGVSGPRLRETMFYL